MYIKDRGWAVWDHLPLGGRRGAESPSPHCKVLLPPQPNDAFFGSCKRRSSSAFRCYIFKKSVSTSFSPIDGKSREVMHSPTFFSLGPPSVHISHPKGATPCCYAAMCTRSWELTYSPVGRIKGGGGGLGFLDVSSFSSSSPFLRV